MADLMNTNQVQTMSSREIAELTGKRHDHVTRDIETMLEQVGEGLPKFGDTYIDPQNGQEYKQYLLPKNLTINLITGYRADIRLKVIDRWIELEKRHHSVSAVPINFVEALRLAADTQEKLELAIATKAEIGSRRKATAMNTACQATKKIAKLEIELDRSKEYFSVKRMAAIHHGQHFNWRLLKSTGIEMGIAPVNVFDQNYGTVKAYHQSVWREAYALDAA